MRAIFLIVLIATLFANCETVPDKVEKTRQELIEQQDSIITVDKKFHAINDSLLKKHNELIERINSMKGADSLQKDKLSGHEVVFKEHEVILNAHKALREVHDEFLENHKNGHLSHEEMLQQLNEIMRDHEKMMIEHNQIKTEQANIGYEHKNLSEQLDSIASKTEKEMVQDQQ